MAIIDTLTGYYGFTLDNPNDGSLVGVNGEVNKCIVVITYPVQVNDVDVTISNGNDDWAIKMGDGDIIPCHNPNPIYINRDNCVVEFDMEKYYPSNSPCSLVYHSDTASFGITQRSSTRPFEVNSASGHFAYTIDGYKGSTILDNDYTGTKNQLVGLVNKVMATIPFPYQVSNVKPTISNADSHWGVRMGDGTIIPLKNPEIVAVNQDNFIVIFTMHDGYSYPSNSPCILVYRSQDASISIDPIDDDNNFYPVSTIYDYPLKMISGQLIDLNCTKVEPYNASCQHIDWSIVSGPGEIRNRHYLYASKGGTVKVRATIENALEGDDAVNDFVHTFDVNVTQNVITIDAQPVTEINAFAEKINYEISVVAKSLTDKISYQWYVNRGNTLTDATIITGATNAKFQIPKTLQKGNYYYFCKLISDGADDVYTSICHVYVGIDITGVEITSQISSISLESTHQLSFRQIPSNGDVPMVVWKTSNSDMMEVDDTGKLRSKMRPGDVTITVMTLDGRFQHSIKITIDNHIPVTDITGISTEIGFGENYQLNGIVEPDNATFKTMKWEMDNAGSTGATFNNGVLHAFSEGVIKVHATIEQGFTLKSPFKKDFTIRVVNKKFTPVTNITLLNDTSKSYCLDEIVTLQHTVVPQNASNSVVNFSLVSGPGTLNNNVLSFTGGGTIKIRCTIINGKSNGQNFIKDFSFTCTGQNAERELVEGNDSTFVAVDDIKVNFINEQEDGTIYTNEFFNPFIAENNPMILPYTIEPDFATNKDTLISIKKITSKIKPDEVLDGSFDIPQDDSFWSADDWTEENLSLVTFDSNTSQIYCNTSLLKVSRYYKVTIHFTVPDGKGINNAFEKDVDIKIETETVKPFVPLSDFKIFQPSKFRTYYPLIVGSFAYIPVNATIKDELKLEMVRHFIDNYESEDDVVALIYKPSAYDLYHTIKPKSIFDWGNDTLYLYPYNPGKLKFTVRIYDATVTDPSNFDPFYPEKTYLDKKFEIDVLPPFIPVKDILNIPSQVNANSKVILSPDVNTNGGLDCYNPCWDEEVATNSAITWEIIDPNNTGTTIDENGVITVGSVTDTTFTLKATIPEGTQEYLYWYYKDEPAIDYVKEFSITIVAEETASTNPILVLTLNDNSTVNIVKLSEMCWICSTAPSNSQITLDGKTFAKSDVKGIEFKSITDANYQLKTLKNFARNFISLTTLTGSIPSTVTGESCLENFMQGCTSFNQPITIPNTVNGKYAMKYFMKDCTSFNSAITLPNALTGEGCLHGFLDGCTSFNQAITIPSTVTGKSCLERFLRGCTSFNKPLTIPSGVTGYACLRSFLMRCSSFNQPLTLPTDVGTFVDSDGYLCGRQINSMLEGADSMCSTITVPEATGKNTETSQRAFCSFNWNSPIVQTGVLFAGAGATDIVKKLSTNYELDSKGRKPAPPWVHIRNLD